MVPLFLKKGLTPAKSNNLTKHFLLIIPLGAACGGGGTFIGSGRPPAAAEMFLRQPATKSVLPNMPSIS